MKTFLWGLLEGTYWGRKGSRFRSRTDLRTWQEKALRKQLANVRKSSPFYRECAPSGELADFPLMEKSTLLEQFDRINAAGLYKEQVTDLAKRSEQNRNFSPTLNGITVGRSTGTSGQHGIFAVNPVERGFWAGYVLRRMLPLGIFADERVALALRSGSNLYQAVGRGRIHFLYLDLTLPLGQVLEQFATYKPTVIVGTPAILRILAENNQDLKLKPRLVISAADVLEANDREILEKTFLQPVQQIYQATEGLLGLSCSLGAIHLCEDLVHFEYETHDDGRVSPIITDLRRQTLPLVRYRLKDLLKLSPEPCPCGSPLQMIEGIEGRADQILYARSTRGEEWKRIFPDYIRHTLADAIEDFGLRTEYQVRQVRSNMLTVSLSTDLESNELKELITKRIGDLFHRNGCVAPTTEFHHLEPSALTQKRRRIIREFEPTSGNL